MHQHPGYRLVLAPATVLAARGLPRHFSGFLPHQPQPVVGHFNLMLFTDLLEEVAN